MLSQLDVSHAELQEEHTAVLAEMAAAKSAAEDAEARCAISQARVADLEQELAAIRLQAAAEAARTVELEEEVGVLRAQQRQLGVVPAQLRTSMLSLLSSADESMGDPELLAPSRGGSPCPSDTSSHGMTLQGARSTVQPVQLADAKRSPTRSPATPRSRIPRAPNSVPSAASTTSDDGKHKAGSLAAKLHILQAQHAKTLSSLHKVQQQLITLQSEHTALHAQHTKAKSRNVAVAAEFELLQQQHKALLQMLQRGQGDQVASANGSTNVASSGYPQATQQAHEDSAKVDAEQHRAEGAKVALKAALNRAQLAESELAELKSKHKQTERALARAVEDDLVTLANHDAAVEQVWCL